ncbi:MAG: hypothetical protein JSV60_02945 [Desulfobacterales bacterium]|jgi:hypothetical protein|nr:MAG: hypothetical protein JSV60_02945 [Desulfobacterales bacterium]
MKNGLSLLFLLTIVSSAVAGEAETPAARSLPQEAFRLLAESASDPCSICAKETREKAFRVLERAFKPGKILKSNHLCQFIRTDACGENELALTCYLTPLPLLTFRFHTAANHLVGISTTDLTEKRLANEYFSAATGARFEGTLEIVTYKYGDGPSYNYYFTGNHIQVHCRILDIKQIKVEQSGKSLETD